MRPKKRVQNTVSAAVLLIALALLAGCGGGGGGGDGGGRTTKTGLRLIHGSVDGTPLTVKVAGIPVMTTGFLQNSDFVAVEPGPVALVVEQANVGTVIRTLPLTLEEETEYSLFVSGESRAGVENIQVLAEPVERPETGEGRVQFFNSVIGSGPLTLRSVGFTSSATAIGQSSGFQLTESGLRDFEIVNRSGTVLGRVSFELPDRGESSVLAAGSIALGVFFTQVYQDLD